MIQYYQYQNENYKIIDGIKIYGIDFVICQNSNEELTYMKITQLANKSVFTPLENLIKVLEVYNNNRVFNIKKIMDYFINTINKSLKKKKIKNENIRGIVKDFAIFCQTGITIINEEVTSNDYKQIKRFVKRYEPKPIVNKFCNIYGVMLLISIIGLSFFTKNFVGWYLEGRNSKNISSDIIADTNITEKDGFSKDEVIAILDNEEDVNKYSYSYWAYSNVTMLSTDFTDLLIENPDTVAWLYVNNTNINYPVVQSGDNSFYLNHSFNKNYSNAGWIFADYRSNLKDLEKNTVIYGHGRKDNTMFGTLDNTLSSTWYTEPENQIIKLSTPSKDMLWQVVSIYTIPAESYYLTHTFENDDTYNKFLETIVSRSIYDFNVNVTTDDHILTLSTCLDNSGNRIVVHSKLVKEAERD